MKKIIGLFILTVLLFAGCVQEEPQSSSSVYDGTTTTSSTTTSTTVNPLSSIDYTNYTGEDCSVALKNNSSKNLVAFVNSPRENNLISGIPANSANHGLKKTDFFSESTDFILFLITEEDYRANINNLSKLDNKPFTKLYCYYNGVSANNNEVYEFSENLGGECSVILNNTTNYSVELHQDRINGPIIGFVPSGTFNTTYSLKEGDYYFYIVLKKYDSTTGEIITAVPTYNGGDDDGKVISRVCPLSDDHPSYTIDVNLWIDGAKMSTEL